MNIPAEIKKKRLALKETQKDFAKRFKVSHAAVSDWESGKSEATYQVIEFVHDCSNSQRIVIHQGHCCDNQRLVIPTETKEVI